MTGHEGSEREYQYSCIVTLTSALDWAGWLKPRPGHFTSGQRDPVPILQEVELAPGSVWTGT